MPGKSDYLENRILEIGAASDNRVQLATGTTFATLVGTNFP